MTGPERREEPVVAAVKPRRRGRTADGGATRTRLRLRDAVAVSTVGLRARRVRATLSAFGIAVAIAAVVAVLGIAQSSKAQLLDQLGQEGNLLTVASGKTFGNQPAPLPQTAPAMIARIPPVRAITTVGDIPGVSVRRSAAVGALHTGGIVVLAAQPTLPGTLAARLRHGTFLTRPDLPETVLGAQSARTLGIDRVDATTTVFIGGQYFAVVGILEPVSVAPEFDTAALIGFEVAGTLFHVENLASRVYLRVDPDQVADVMSVLAFTASPEQPQNVQVRRPSDVLLARIDAAGAFVGLFLGLGGIALLVAGVGIANIMVISVLERRAEIGLRRSLGARRRDVAVQFLLESAILAAAGGILGIGLGCLATAVAAHLAGNPVVIPPEAVLAGLAAALAVGALAGGYPALRAARLPPADALRTL